MSGWFRTRPVTTHPIVFEIFQSWPTRWTNRPTNNRLTPSSLTACLKHLIISSIQYVGNDSLSLNALWWTSHTDIIQHQSHVVFYLPSFTQTSHCLMVGEALEANPIHLQQSVTCKWSENFKLHFTNLYFPSLSVSVLYIPTWNPCVGFCFCLVILFFVSWKQQLNAKMHTPTSPALISVEFQWHGVKRSVVCPLGELLWLQGRCSKINLKC